MAPETEKKKRIFINESDWQRLSIIKYRTRSFTIRSTMNYLIGSWEWQTEEIQRLRQRVKELEYELQRQSNN